MGGRRRRYSYFCFIFLFQYFSKRLQLRQQQHPGIEDPPLARRRHRRNVPAPRARLGRRGWCRRRAPGHAFDTRAVLRPELLREPTRRRRQRQRQREHRCCRVAAERAFSSHNAVDHAVLGGEQRHEPHNHAGHRRAAGRRRPGKNDHHPPPPRLFLPLHPPLSHAGPHLPCHVLDRRREHLGADC